MSEARGLRQAVAAAVGQNVVGLRGVRREPLEYDAFLAHRAVGRLRGYTLVADGGVVEWSMIEKATEGPHLAVPYLTDNATREFAAYRSGALDALGPALRAPRLYGSVAEEDGRTVLWLEEVHHHGGRPLDAASILQAARALGGMSARWLGGGLRDPWLFRGWIDRHSQPEAVAGARATLRRRHPAVAARLGDRVAATEKLIDDQRRLRAVLEALPQTLCHHDAVGANVFVGTGETVLIDWESVGPGAVGADLASLLFSSVRRGDASAAVVIPLVDEALDAYLKGAAEKGHRISAADARRGLDAAIGLRWKLLADIATALERGEAMRRGSLPDDPPERALEEHLAQADLLLRSAERALEG